MKKMGLLFTGLLLILLGCSDEPTAVMTTIPTGVTTIKTNASITVELSVYDTDTPAAEITYQFKANENDAWRNKIGNHHFSTSYPTDGTKMIQGRIWDGTNYSNIASISITVNNGIIPGTGKDTVDLSNDGTVSTGLHRNITASTFWAGEGASGDNQNITNDESAWDSHWGRTFGLKDAPDIARNGSFIPTSSSFSGKENPYYFALPYNDYNDVVYDGNEAATVAGWNAIWHTRYASYLNRDIVYTTSMNGDRKASTSDLPWSWSGNGTSMVKARWIRIKALNTNSVVYAQWGDAGPYFYDDIEYVFKNNGSQKPSNDGMDSPFAGIDLSPSVCLGLGQILETWGAPGFQVEWEFVNAQDVPHGPWKRYRSSNNTNW